MIENIKHLNILISQAKSEASHLSSNKAQLNQIKSLSLQIHDKYLTASCEQARIEKNILSHRLKLEENSHDLDYYRDALIRLLIPQDFSLTLVYKSQSNIPYIKGRVYWDNKQREVQIGSIKNVISQIKGLCKDGLIPPIKGIGKKNIQWDYIKSTPEIESAVKYVGKIKFKQYLLKYFKFPSKSKTSNKLNIKSYNDLTHLIHKTPSNSNTPIVNIDDNYSSDPENTSFDWYKNWRDGNE